MLLYLYSRLLRLRNRIQTIFVRRQFNANAKVGENFVCREMARCVNESKKKDNIIIGNNVSILGELQVENFGKIEIGDYTTIRAKTRVISLDNVKIGSYVIISNNVLIIDNNSHPTGIKEREKMSIAGPDSQLWHAKYSKHKPVVIEDNVWIGERAVILKGVTIARGSIVACDAVVTHNVPENSIVAGNPAIVVKTI